MFIVVALLVCACLAASAQGAHVQCGDTITVDTTLDSDLRNCPGDGLVIAGDDVTVDFAGHEVDGTGTGNGVRTEGNSDRFTLVGGTIRQFRDGVLTEEVHALLRQMRILDNVKYGVEAYGAGADVRDSLVSGNEIGTWQASTSNSTFTHNSDVAILYSEGVGTHTGNVVRHNGNGIALAEGDGIAARNVVTDNSGTGISWEFSGHGAIRDNLVARNDVGISVRSYAEPLVEGNLVLRNRSDGVTGHWSDGSGSIVRANKIERNGGHGIFVTGFASCPQLRDNYLSRNGRDGILVESLGERRECDEVPIVGNRASRNAADGIHVADNTDLVLVARNETDHNGDDGIDVDAQGGAGTTPTWSPDSRLIAFVSTPASGGLPQGPGLYVAAPDGSGLRLIGPGEHPDWAPDGQRIVFAMRGADPGVWTVRPDGTGLTKIAPSSSRPDHPTWSPDGQTIAYYDEGRLWVVPATGGTPQPLTSGTPANDPEWSPDGTRILFESSPDLLGDGNIYLTDPSGSQPTFVATGKQATWSPDGAEIVFVRGADLWIVRPDGTGLRRLTGDLLADSKPTWSPDGDAIAFYRDGVQTAGLYTIRPDGTGLAPVAVASGGRADGLTSPAWSPDGTRLAFEEVGRLWVVRRDGTRLIRITLVTNPLVTLTSNTADHNRDLGIEAAPEVVDGGGNRAKRNGDRRQCVGVPCR